MVTEFQKLNSKQLEFREAMAVYNFLVGMKHDIS